MDLLKGGALLAIIVGFWDKIMEVEIHIAKEEQETPAQFQEYCTQIALKEYWNKKVSKLKYEENKESIEKIVHF